MSEVHSTEDKLIAKALIGVWIGFLPLILATKKLLRLEGPDLDESPYERAQGVTAALSLLESKKRAGAIDRSDPEQKAAIALIEFERERLKEYLGPQLVTVMLYDLKIATGWLLAVALVVLWWWL